MDDLFIKGNSLEEGKNLLNRANMGLSWARMSLKPGKSKVLILKGGKVQHDKVLTITSSNEILTIPSIVNNPVQFLGRTISFNLHDHDEVKSFSLAVEKGLSLLDQSAHRGIHKT